MKVLDFPNVSYIYDFSRPEFFTRELNAANNDYGIPIPEISFSVNDAPITNLFGSDTNPVLLDWVDIAIAVYLADRVSPRDPRKHHNENWVRDFMLKLRVRSPDFWSQDDIQTDLNELLSYLTDDNWQFEFSPLLVRDRFFESQRELAFLPNSTPRVALYSGGLDSFAGAAMMLATDIESPFIFVSGATHPRQISQQREQIQRLRGLQRKGEIIHCGVKFGIKWKESEGAFQEVSQRTRGFLFSTFGAVASINSGARTLELYENGIGAINLPYDASQISAMNSRSVNPVALLRMESLAMKIFGEQFAIQNKFWSRTKGEMCSNITPELIDAVALTFSCDGFPVRAAGKPQCGVCTSCLIRRLSLSAANLSKFDIGETYLTDLTSAYAFPSFEQLRSLRAMDWQYHQINQCLTGPNPWQELAFEFPELQTIVSELVAAKGVSFEGVQNDILRLYKKYCDEWSGFSARNHLFRSASRAA